MSFSPACGLIFLTDNLSGAKFLVDTGASLSILLHSSIADQSGPKLVGVQGTATSTWGFQQKTIVFGKARYTFNFLLAIVAMPIIGADFLKKFRLDVSPSLGQVVFSAKGRTLIQESGQFPGGRAPANTVGSSSNTPALSNSVSQQVQRLLQKYPGITTPGTVLPPPRTWRQARHRDDR
jgi:predicted aspartyl protease